MLLEAGIPSEDCILPTLCGDVDQTRSASLRKFNERLTLLAFLKERHDYYKRKRPVEHDFHNDYSSAGPDILAIARLASGASATKLEDIIYNVFGLITSKEAQLIGVDYSLPCSKVYTKATYASIYVRRDLDILSLVSLNKGRMDGLPSWAVDILGLREYKDVKDWRQPYYDTRLTLDSPSKPQPFACLQPVLCVNAPSGHLRVPGILCGKVTCVRVLGRMASCRRRDTAVRSGLILLWNFYNIFQLQKSSSTFFR